MPFECPIVESAAEHFVYVQTITKYFRRKLKINQCIALYVLNFEWMIWAFFMCNWIHIQATDVFEIQTFWFINTFWNKCWKKYEKWEKMIENDNNQCQIEISIFRSIRYHLNATILNHIQHSIWFIVHSPYSHISISIYCKQIQRHGCSVFNVWLIDVKFEFRVNGLRWTKRRTIVNYLPYAIMLSPKIHIRKCIVEKLNVFTILLMSADCRRVSASDRQRLYLKGFCALLKFINSWGFWGMLSWDAWKCRLILVCCWNVFNVQCVMGGRDWDLSVENGIFRILQFAF